MTALAHSLDRTVLIRAPRDTVFGFFTDSARWAAWWGAGSAIDPKPGGAVRIRYPDGTDAVGEVLEIAAPERLVFTYGYATGTPIPPGGSRVTIQLDSHEDGTRLRLEHQFAEASIRETHLQGWRYQLSLFSNIIANEVYADAVSGVDGWFAAWAITGEQARQEALAQIAAPSVRFRDRFSVVDGIAELVPHIAGAQRFMPGIGLRREGPVRHCQGTVLADWIAATADGQPRGRGTSVFVFGPDQRLTSVIGFWN